MSAPDTRCFTGSAARRQADTIAQVIGYVDDLDRHGSIDSGVASELRIRIRRILDAAQTVQHSSDCAVHNAPALPVGPCNCGAELAASRKSPRGVAAVRLVSEQETPSIPDQPTQGGDKGEAVEIEKLRGLLRASHQNCLALWEALEGGASPRCRDCADFNGRCQGTGPACEPQERAMERIKALRTNAYTAKDAYEVARHIIGYLEGNCGLSFVDVEQDDWDAITRLVATLAMSSTEGK